MKSTSLTLAEFHILLALADGDRHGYGIMQEAEHLSQGSVRLGPGTLYRTLKHLLAESWIEDVGERPTASDNGDTERRRYYRLTPTGRKVAEGEAHRLETLVNTARARRLLHSGSL